MNPTEPVSAGGVAVADKPISQVGESPIGAAPSQTPSPDISRVEDLVAAAQQEAAAVAQAPTPAQTPAENDFAKQFGGVTSPVEPTSATTPPAESNVADPMGQALAGLGTPSNVQPAVEPLSSEEPVAKLDESIKTMDDLLAKGPQTAEAEQTPAEKLKQQIAASVDAFLDEVTKEKVSA